MANPDESLTERVRAEFDAAFYLAKHADVAEAGADPFDHFMMFGWREGRDPSPDFSLARYLAFNPDVEKAGINPFQHYIEHGRAENRQTDHGLGFRYEILWKGQQLEDRIQSLKRLRPPFKIAGRSNLARAVAKRGFPEAFHVTVSHDDYVTGLGGVQLCLRLESQAMRGAGRCHVHLFPASAALVVEIEEEGTAIGVLIDGEAAGFYKAEDVAAVLGPWMVRHAPTLAVHSLIGHRVPDVLNIVASMGIETGYFWLHDYASVCAGYALMRNDVEYCGAPPLTSTACSICDYGRRRGIQVAEHVRMFLALDLTVLAPSRATFDLWRPSFPLTPKAGHVHHHARLIQRTEDERALTPADRPLRVAFCGMPTVHKGWPIFADLVKRFGDDPRFEFHHFAMQRDPTVKARFTAVRPTAQAKEPMITALREAAVDVAIVWSLVPETFCFAAYEAVATGAAILTNPVAGHVVDFVRAEGCGLIVDDEDALAAIFDSGSVLDLARSKRRPASYDLIYSRMTADFILEKAS